VKFHHKIGKTNNVAISAPIHGSFLDKADRYRLEESSHNNINGNSSAPVYLLSMARPELKPAT
jgi:hypothetical protein